MIAATNSWVLCFDNLSSISSELSDALCCIATGGGFASRELYSDGDEKLFSSIRPVIINGIAELATRSDLLDRSIILTLPAIPEESRREEEELWQEFDDAQPRILGAILSVVASALARKAHVKLPQKPRMADFAKWVVAAEPALGWRTGEFLDIFTDNRAMANSAALDESILASPIQAFMAENDRWEGTATGLLSELCKRVDEKTQKRREWPSRPNKLSSDLRRLAPNLRRVGIHVEIDRKPGGHRRRCISLERVDKGPSPASPGVPSESKHPGAVQNGRDDRDGRDDEMPLRSHGDLPGEEVVEWTA